MQLPIIHTTSPLLSPTILFLNLNPEAPDPIKALVTKGVLQFRDPDINIFISSEQNLTKKTFKYPGCQKWKSTFEEGLKWE
jgi:hypothetical protein